MNTTIINNRNKKGFTLAELLIVVAIIAILVAVSIPVFASKQAQARESTCAANRSSLKAVLVNDFTSGDGAFDLTDGSHTLTGTAKDEYVCPDGGIITYEVNNSNSTITVKCSKHSGSRSFGNKDDMDEIQEILKSIGNDIIDSTAGTSGPKLQEFIKQMEAAGVNLDGAGTWRYNNGYLTFVPQTISNSSSDNLKYIIQYNFSSGNYTVWNAGSTKQQTANGATYYILPDHGSNLQNKEVSDQTYEKAMEIYNSLMGQ